MQDKIDYKGKPCRGCGENIKCYSLSGLCRDCWNVTRNNPELNFEERIKILMMRHSKDKGKYHTLSINGRAIPEHRYIWQKHYKKELPYDWVVHHLNGLKGDNRIENLVAMPKSDHDTKHLVTTLQSRIRDLEDEQ